MIRFQWIDFSALKNKLPDEPVPHSMMTPIPAQNTKVPTIKPTQTNTVNVETTPTGTVQTAPEFILVFIPMNWSSDYSEFVEQAEKQADFFIQESNIENYFVVTKVFLEEGLEDVNLNSDTLTNDVIVFGMGHTPGDRYIAMTDGDISPDGFSDVVGWTMGYGYTGVVAESEFISVAAHELGHTFGLCDEYDYDAWVSQDEEAVNGCPNPYPETCPKEGIVENGTIPCDGLATEDGRSSIMGPAIEGDLGFNTPCLEGLANAFESMVQELNQ